MEKIDVVKWLESSDGETWSRQTHGWVYGLVTIKDDESMHDVPSFCERTDYLW
jgi:hypothetical protein